jgi:hypothetical protein
MIFAKLWNQRRSGKTLHPAPTTVFGLMLVLTFG